jgi:hypothetical protein
MPLGNSATAYYCKPHLHILAIFKKKPQITS